MPKRLINPFDYLAPYYEAIYPPKEMIKKTVSFIASILPKDQEKKEIKILEVFSRIGFYSIELAKLGFNVKGIDNSKEMIKRAQKLAIEENVEPDFEYKSLEDEEKKEEKYDLILFLNNSLSFITAQKQLKMTLIYSKKLLKPTGKIILQVVNYKVRKQKSRYYPLRSIIEPENNNEVIIQRFLDLEPKLFYNVNIIGKKEDSWKYIHKFSFPLTFYSVKNLQNNVSVAGLGIEKIYGDFDKNEFKEKESKNIIMILNQRNS